MHRWRVFPVLLLLVLLPLRGHAAASKTLTSAQDTALGAYIQAQPEFQPYLDPPQDQAIANVMNLAANPTFFVWRTSVTPENYTGAASIVWEDINTIPAGKARIFEWLTGTLTRAFDPSDSNVRDGLDRAFSPGLTYTNLLALSKRPATRAEWVLVVLKTGVGTLETPGLLAWEGLLGHLDVARALGRNSEVQP